MDALQVEQDGLLPYLFGKVPQSMGHQWLDNEYQTQRITPQKLHIVAYGCRGSKAINAILERDLCVHIIIDLHLDPQEDCASEEWLQRIV